MLPLDRIRALLREHDDPRHLERPAGFDLRAAADCWAGLVSAFEDRFGPSCSSGLGQDASFYGVLDVPADATGLGVPLRATMSNFGGCFVTARVVAGEGSPSDGADLPEELVTWLDGLCTALGCTFVPAELLREPYDGPSALPAAQDVELAAVLAAAGVAAACEKGDEDLGKADWSDRYFDYV